MTLAILAATLWLFGAGHPTVTGPAIAFGWTCVPDPFFAAHPGTVEVAFIIPVAMGLSANVGARVHPRRPGRARRAKHRLCHRGLDHLRCAAGPRRGPHVGVGPPSRTPRAGRWLVAGATIVCIFIVWQMAQGDSAQIPRGQILSFLQADDVVVIVAEPSETAVDVASRAQRRSVSSTSMRPTATVGPTSTGRSPRP